MTKINLFFILMFAFLLVGCGFTLMQPNNTEQGTQTNTQTNNTAQGNKIYADGNSTSLFSFIDLEPSIPNTSNFIWTATANGPTGITVLTQPIIGGADGSDYYIRIGETIGNSAGIWGVFWWSFSSPLEVVSERNIPNLTFYIRSAVANVNNISLSISTGTNSRNAASTTVNKNFAADNTWQKVTISLLEFTPSTDDFVGTTNGFSDGIPDGRDFNFNDGIKTVGFILSDLLTSSDNPIAIDIDEVVFINP